MKFCGELSYRADTVDNPFYGFHGVDRNNYLQRRFQIHADLHLTDGALCTFVQLEDTCSCGKALPIPTGESQSEVHQAFMDNNWLGGGAPLCAFFKPGNSLCFNEFLSYRDTPNMRYNFDGIRISWARRDGARADTFAVHPVTIQSGAFSDGSDSKKLFSVMYVSLPTTGTGGIDFYGYSMDNEHRSLGGGESGDEQRYTFGARWYGDQQGWRRSMDLAAQHGEMGDIRISAWAVSSEWGYGWNKKGSPLLMMRFDIASGDKQPGKGRLEAFDPLFSCSQVYGEAGLTTLPNAMIVGSVFSYSLHPKVHIEPAVLGVRKQSQDDSVYAPSLTPVQGTEGTARRVGIIYKTRVNWRVSSNLTVHGDVLWFDVGPALQSAGGDNSAFFSLRDIFRF
ncbi:alginate export family protein [Pseudomonas sp. RW10S2]|uniref:alginate export family protein n=1 Tax=Pseudomonas sp. RW10S2 TaxID=459637 RepID=UPI001647316F|nr:alginate export family protein [Pseudomonas sp. RW10S2]MBC3467513.1 alginate export family protein [Pseudomonas sp. RW10S2]